MAIRSGAAATEAGETDTSAGGGGGADSAPSPVSSWTIVGGREVALGGLSPKESSPWGDAVGRMGTLAAFLLLKGATHKGLGREVVCQNKKIYTIHSFF